MREEARRNREREVQVLVDSLVRLTMWERVLEAGAGLVSAAGEASEGGEASAGSKAYEASTGSGLRF
jgi:hypothetical protein